MSEKKDSKDKEIKGEAPLHYSVQVNLPFAFSSSFCKQVPLRPFSLSFSTTSPLSSARNALFMATYTSLE
jgi:hypothetical protein